MTEKPFRPLLAAKVDPEDFEKLNFPVIASPKVDGIRCLIKDGQAISRTLKPIPNRHIQALLTGAPDGLDGELVTFTGGVLDDFNTIQSKVMSRDGEPEFALWVFDVFNAKLPYYDRLDLLLTVDHPRIHRLAFCFVPDITELVRIENVWVRQGWEGVMLRNPHGPYKQGRSTLREQTLLKLKKFDDDEAVIVDMIELMHNENEATKDELGHTKRSSSKEGKVPAGVMGALVLEWRGMHFEIGTGFTAEQRQDFWERREELNGSLITFKFQGVGSLGRPRFPVFLGFRPELEASRG